MVFVNLKTFHVLVGVPLATSSKILESNLATTTTITTTTDDEDDTTPQIKHPLKIRPTYRFSSG